MTTHVTHRLLAAEATEQTAKNIDPSEVLYQIDAEDVLGILEECNEYREEQGEDVIVLSGDEIRKIGDNLCVDWAESIREQIDDIARVRKER